MQPNGHGEVQSEPLFRADTAFLNLEGKAISRNVASVWVCAGGTPFQNGPRVVGSRLPVISGYLKWLVDSSASE